MIHPFEKTNPMKYQYLRCMRGIEDRRGRKFTKKEQIENALRWAEDSEKRFAQILDDMKE